MITNGLFKVIPQHLYQPTLKPSFCFCEPFRGFADVFHITVLLHDSNIRVLQGSN